MFKKAMRMGYRVYILLLCSLFVFWGCGDINGRNPTSVAQVSPTGLSQIPNSTCVSENYRGFDLRCFSSQNASQSLKAKMVQEWLEFLRADTQQYDFLQPEKDPFTYVLNRVDIFTYLADDDVYRDIKTPYYDPKDFYNHVASASGVNIFGLQEKVVGLFPFAFFDIKYFQNPSYMSTEAVPILQNSFFLPSTQSNVHRAMGAALLLHEADHSSYGPHKTQVGMDDPYGLQMRYLIEVALSGHHPLLNQCSDRYRIIDEAFALGDTNIYKQDFDNYVASIFQPLADFYNYTCP